MGTVVNSKQYIRDGVAFDRTTEIIGSIDPELAIAKRGAEQAFASAGERGTLVHGMIADALKYESNERSEKLIRENRADILLKYIYSENHQPTVEKRVKNAFHWIDENVQEILQVEKTLYDEKWRFAGTIDLIAMVKGKRTIIDWKTAAKPSMWSWSLQTAAYSMLARSLATGHDRYVVRLLETDGPAPHIVFDDPMDMTYFQYAITLKRAKEAKK